MNSIVAITSKPPELVENESMDKLNMTRLNKIHDISEANYMDPPIVGPSQYFSILGI